MGIYCLWFDDNHVSPSLRPSPVVATQGCTYLGREGNEVSTRGK